jgi:hypothetical protein
MDVWILLEDLDHVHVIFGSVETHPRRGYESSGLIHGVEGLVLVPDDIEIQVR